MTIVARICDWVLPLSQQKNYRASHYEWYLFNNWNLHKQEKIEENLFLLE